MNNLDKTMNTNEQENYDSTNEAEETVNIEEEVEEQEEDNELENLREELAATLKENKTLKFQKAKLKDKANAPQAPAAQPAPIQKEGDLSSRDVIAIIEGKVPEQDIDDVREYAQLKNISISDALKSNVVKTILSDNAEQRKVSSASNVGSSKRAASVSSDEQLLANARAGKMPASMEDMMRLENARRKKK